MTTWNWVLDSGFRRNDGGVGFVTKPLPVIPDLIRDPLRETRTKCRLDSSLRRNDECCL